MEKHDIFTGWLTNQLAIWHEHKINCCCERYTIHFSKLLPCFFSQTVRLIQSYIHIYQSTHSYKSTWLKDLWQGRAEKSDFHLTCSTAGGGLSLTQGNAFASLRLCTRVCEEKSLKQRQSVHLNDWGYLGDLINQNPWQSPKVNAELCHH